MEGAAPLLPAVWELLLSAAQAPLPAGSGLSLGIETEVSGWELRETSRSRLPGFVPAVRRVTETEYSSPGAQGSSHGVAPTATEDTVLTSARPEAGLCGPLLGQELTGGRLAGGSPLGRWRLWDSAGDSAICTEAQVMLLKVNFTFTKFLQNCRAGKEGPGATS